MVKAKTVSQIHTANQQGKPLTIKTTAFLPDTQHYIDAMLQVFLDDLGIGFVHSHISYCIKELGVNAKKANTKRVYFEERKLNIDDPNDYALGMKTFKSDTLNDQPRYLKLLEEKNYYIKIEFLHYNKTCSIAIKNNVTIHPEELKRIDDKIRKAQKYDTIEEALSEVLDESEGAGLGILVMVLMLRQLGFDGEFFHIYSQDAETVARIVLPLSSDDA